MQLWEEWRSKGAVGPEEATKAGRLLNERCFLLFFAPHIYTQMRVSFLLKGNKSPEFAF